MRRADRLRVHMIKTKGSNVWHYASEAYTNKNTKLIHYADCQTAFFDVAECRDFWLAAKLPDVICAACRNVRRGLTVRGERP